MSRRCNSAIAAALDSTQTTAIWEAASWRSASRRSAIGQSRNNTGVSLDARGSPRASIAMEIERVDMVFFAVKANESVVSVGKASPFDLHPCLSGRSAGRSNRGRRYWALTVPVRVRQTRIGVFREGAHSTVPTSAVNQK